MLTLKERKKIKDYLKSKDIDIMEEPGYSCMVGDEFYEGLMDKYGLYWHKGEVVSLEEVTQ